MNGLRLDTLPPMRSFIDRGGQWVAGQVALFAAWAVALATFRVSLPVWVVVTGAVLGLVGSALGLAGLRGLGPSLTPYPEPRRGAQLVETGVYGLVRHPIYGGIGIVGNRSRFAGRLDPGRNHRARVARVLPSQGGRRGAPARRRLAGIRDVPAARAGGIGALAPVRTVA